MPIAISETIRLLMPDGTVKRILLEDYVRGVVAAALPADAPLEALKGQAVAARTFAASTRRHLDRGAEVCTGRHCQMWSERANPAASRAVIETRSIVATFDDELIQAFYFEHCDGHTRKGSDVLLNAPVYLEGVQCGCGSASMKGHGVGMCQRGMLVMARFGDPYDTILKHYYTGITLEPATIDPKTRAPLTPRTRPAARPAETPTSGKTPRARKPVTSPAPADSPAPAKPADAPPPAKTPSPRRSSRRKLEQEAVLPDAPTETAPPEISEPQAAAPHAVAPQIAEPPASVSEAKAAPIAPPIPPEDLLTSDKPLAAEADDLLYYLAIEDVAPPAKPTPAPTPPPLPPEPFFQTPMPSFDDMPPPIYASAPPPTMPEDPNAFELDFLAPPTGESAPPIVESMPPLSAAAAFMTEPPASPFASEPPAATPPEWSAPDATPTFERFFAPVDAPPSMPEEMPNFGGRAGADETPILWAPPPPLEEAASAPATQLLIDNLPGPRIIAGNLPKPGTIVTIRDLLGNSIITVSGVAPHYGAGGFEAPLTDDGAYKVSFDATTVDVKLENESVFIYYS